MSKTNSKNWGNFTPVNANPRYRLIWRSFGPEKTGKDHFALTAPGPIAVQSFDVGLEGVVEKFLKAPLGPKEIVATEYEFNRDDCNREAAEAIRDQFIADYDLALSHARTIIWDTESEIWEVFRFAEFDAMSDAPKQYVELNAKYRDLIQRAYEADVNLCLIQKVKEKWLSVDGVNRDGRKVSKPMPSGMMEPTGFKECGYLVQANLRHSWDRERGFVVEILNCRQNMGVAGEAYPNLDFPTLAQLIFPDSEDTDWV